MFRKISLVACAATASLAFSSMAALADGHAFTEGPVVNVSSIRTEPGKFDEYMNWVDTVWKARQEAAKKSGYVLSYRVVRVEPRSENDPDLHLVINYKNWAALDGATARGDALTAQTEGSVEAGKKSTIERGKLRRVLGSWTGQELELK
jgi:hypothetical protein